MKFGKLAKRNDPYYRTLQIDDYLPTTSKAIAEAGLAAPPAGSANLARVYKTWGAYGKPNIFQMDGNDTIGNCTIAALAHFVTMLKAFTGKRVIPTRAQVENLYFQLTGGQDTGLDMLTVCNYIRQNSWLGEPPILAFAECNIKNRYLMQQCISTFGMLYTGFQVPDNCIAQFDAGHPWTPGTLTNEGHCVNLADYTPNDLIAETWGSTIPATWPWEAECVDEAYVLIPAEAATPGYIPGLNVTQLLADLKEVTA